MSQAHARVPRDDEYQGRTLRLVETDDYPTSVPPRRRRSAAATQIQARPDRIALWAVLLGIFLVFMAVATASAAAL